MMKWGRKKPSPSSSSSSSSSLLSSHLPSLSRVVSTTWLSTFKRMSFNSEPKPAKEKQKEIRSFASGSSAKFDDGGERFYGGRDAEGFWRLSFGEDGSDGKISKSLSPSTWYELDDKFDFAPSGYRSRGSNGMGIEGKEETKMFRNETCNVMNTKEFRRDTQILPGMNMSKGEKMAVLKTPRRKMITEKDLKLKKIKERAMEDRSLKLQNKSGEDQQKSVEKPIIERENLKLRGSYQKKHQNMSTTNRKAVNLTTNKEASVVRAQKLAETNDFFPDQLSLESDKWKSEE